MMFVPVAINADFFNHSINSTLCLVWIRDPHRAQVRQNKFCLRVCQVVFLVVLPCSPHLLIGPSNKGLNNLKSDENPNKTCSHSLTMKSFSELIAC